MHRLQELVRLHRLGEGGRETARLLGMGPNTERTYRTAIDAAGLLAGDAAELPALEALKAAVMAHAPPKIAPQQQSSIAAFRAAVEALMDRGLRPGAIFDRLRLEDTAFKGSRSSVKRLVATIARERGVSPNDVAIPVESAAGEIAQVDFGYVGHLYDPLVKTLRRAWVFVMVLGHSRHLFADIVFDQRTETWLRLHVAAFAALRGVPGVLVPDNLKAAVIRAAFGIDSDSALNRSYRELARHYDFKIDPAPPYAARKKGKVEAGVKYVKRNALAGREGQDVTVARTALQRWIVEIAGERKHGTTGSKPIEVFEREERAALTALPSRPYELVVWHRAQVHRDCHVQFDGRLYSVPWRLVEHEVWLRATPSGVVVYHEDEPVARHDRRGTGLRSTLDSHLPEERAALRHRSRSYWEERADRLGDDVGLYVRLVFDADDVLSQLRKVQAIVTHLEKFPPARATAACRRATRFGSVGYIAIRDILRNGLDLEPLPPEDAHALPPATTRPRFARDVRELVATRIHNDGGRHGAH